MAFGIHRCLDETLKCEVSVAMSTAKKNKAKQSPVTFIPSGTDRITNKDESRFIWCLSSGFRMVSLEEFALTLCRNSAVVRDDYRQLPFPRD